MTVRILNKKQDYDKFWDCLSASIVKIGDSEEFEVYIETRGLGSVGIVLVEGDAVYYMNNEGKTINSDMRMLK